MTNNKGRKKTKLTNGMHRGFTRGIDQIPLGKQSEIKNELRLIIGGSTRAKMYYWIHGRTIIQADKAKQIESVFHQYGIQAIWDE